MIDIKLLTVRTRLKTQLRSWISWVDDNPYLEEESSRRLKRVMTRIYNSRVSRLEKVLTEIPDATLEDFPLKSPVITILEMFGVSFWKDYDSCCKRDNNSRGEITCKSLTMISISKGIDNRMVGSMKNLSEMENCLEETLGWNCISSNGISHAIYMMTVTKGGFDDLDQELLDFGTLMEASKKLGFE